MKKSIIIILLCLLTLAGCSNSKPDAKNSRKDDIAATKKQVKSLCNKIDMKVFRLKRAIDYGVNLDQLKLNFKDIVNQYKLIRTAIKKLPSKNLTGAEKKMAASLIEDLDVIIKDMPIYSEILFKWYTDTDYTEVPLVDGVIESTEGRYEYLIKTDAQYEKDREPYVKSIKESEDHFWTNVGAIYPYLCLGLKVDYTKLQTNSPGL